MELSRGKNAVTVADPVWILAAQLQKQLDVIVTVAIFHYGLSPRAESIPSSLVSISPFCSGGQRRFILNAQSPLVKSLAAAATSKSAASRDAAAMVAQAMVITASWPIPDLDATAALGWLGTGLNCGPMNYHVWPVPYELYQSKNLPLPILDPKGSSSLNAPTHLVIFPLRIVLRKEEVNKANPGTGHENSDPLLRAVALILSLRRPFLRCACCAADLFSTHDSSRCATHQRDSST